MLYREIIAVCSEIHTKHINTLCGQNVESLNVKPGGIYSDHRRLNADSHVILPCCLPVDMACIPRVIVTRSLPLPMSLLM
jgi:hypothetical protein